MSGMLPSMRTRLTALSRTAIRSKRQQFSTSLIASRQGPGTGENFNQANDPLPRKETPNVSQTNELAVNAAGAQDAPLQESVQDAEKKRELQAPNRSGIWSRNQMPRELAMSGPRFEQTIMETQPRPLAAIELIHKQPVRWVHGRSVACDGGGGPLGHPKIFINLDKQQVCWCTYCGLPYANTHHKKYLESLPSTPYPLKSTGDPSEIPMPKTGSQFGDVEIEGTMPQLNSELKAEGLDGQPYSQR